MEGVTVKITGASGESETKVLAPGSYIVGRETGDVVLGDPNASESRARLDVNAGAASITDLGSTNGTYLATGEKATGTHSA